MDDDVDDECLLTWSKLTALFIVSHAHHIQHVYMLG